MPKKNKQSKDAQDGRGPAEAGQKTGKLGKLVLPVVLGITSFCTVYFLPRTESVLNETVEASSASHQTNDKYGEEDTDAIQVETSFVTLEPFTVSLKDRAKILRLSVTIEAPQDVAEMIDPNDPKLRDAFMGYLSALGIEQVQDAAFLVRLRTQLTRRAKFVLGAHSVQNILITDFMVR